MSAVFTHIYIYLFINLQFQYCFAVQFAISFCFFIESAGFVATNWYSKNTQVYGLRLCSQNNATFGDTE